MTKIHNKSVNVVGPIMLCAMAGCGARTGVALQDIVHDDAATHADPSGDGLDAHREGDAVSDQTQEPVAAPDAPQVLCVLEGKTYEPYDHLVGPDNCDCRCTPKGRVTCDGYSCDADASVGLCDYAGFMRQVGENWLGAEGCNACKCTMTGHIDCTWIGCPEYACTWDGKAVHTQEDLLAPDGCNWCRCWESGEVTCTTSWFCL